ncbi:MAG: ATP-dependent Clp protease proteolytic subunit [Tepidiforma sp.]|jgi:ATP-dependent Clp protease protease subunit|uniref:ATP-dependent Clp protease proteolytic subunit n=2 Tax=Tepidiformaceae TaxID=2682227 RepID=A0ABX6C5S1_9CHLR|nr:MULTISPECIES: ATP-dependent Clp protease proteolytic subunit [Tepidiforma]QFG04164.1 ATP-dependent Clp protease proteolytic subunit [Tepidiforma bonchosmolovskayae]GIW15459.1 MAG: ATP-dependent Clp protease proteolytic subunit [Tepidiforma sp.]
MSSSYDLIQELVAGKRPDADIVRPQDIMPFVIESDGRRERAYDIYSLLLKERIVFLGTPIDAMVANLVVAQLLYLAREDDEKDIMMYINCPGGSVTAGLAIYDTMNLIRPQVSTLCMGLAASMGTVILCSGAKGKRYALPHSTIHLHQVLGGAQGQARDIEIQARETLRLQRVLRTIIQERTGQPMEKIEHDTDRDFWLDPPAAKEYGLIDEILDRPPKGEGSPNGKVAAG